MLIDTLESLQPLLTRISKAERLYLDTETSGLKTARGARIIGTVIGFEDGDVFYVPIRHLSDEPQIDPATFFRLFREALEPNRGYWQFVFHNAKFDVGMFIADGIDLCDYGEVHCTEVMSHLVDETRHRHGLKLLGREVLGQADASDLADWVKDQIRIRGYDADTYGYAQFGVAELSPYACQDIHLTRPLFHRFAQVLTEEDLWDVYRREQQIIPVCVAMERQGIRVDRTKLRQSIDTLEQQIPGVRQQMVELVQSVGIYLTVPTDPDISHLCFVGDLPYAGPKLLKKLDEDGCHRVTTSADELAKDPFQSPAKLRRMLAAFGIRPEKRTPSALAAQALLAELRQQPKAHAQIVETKEFQRLLELADVTATDKEVLKAYAKQYPFCALLLEYRFLQKLLNTYFLPYWLGTTDAHPYIHADFRPTATRTGRFSMANPNLQNLVRPDEDRDDALEVKAVIVPGPGKVFVGADYASMEIAMLAGLTGEPKLVDAIINGTDIHKQTAREIVCPALGLLPFDELCVGSDEEPCLHTPHCPATQKKVRQMAKVLNFAVIYGASGKKLRVMLSLASEEEGIAVKRQYFEALPEVKRYRNGIYSSLEPVQSQRLWEEWKRASARGEPWVYPFPRPTRRNLMGRLYHFNVLPYTKPEIKQWGRRTITNYFYAADAHAALNYDDQGTCADVVKEAMIAMHQRIVARLKSVGSTAALVLQVHDELVIECDKAEALYWARELKAVMEHTPWIPHVPMRADPWIAETCWAEKRDLKQLETLEDVGVADRKVAA